MLNSRSQCWQRWSCAHHSYQFSGITSFYYWSIRLCKDARLTAIASNLLLCASSTHAMRSRICSKPSPKGLLCIWHSCVITSHAALSYFKLGHARHILRIQLLQHANYLTNGTQTLGILITQSSLATCHQHCS